MTASPGEQLSVTTTEIMRARALLTPQDFAALGELRSNPDATFSLLRPLVTPGTELFDPLQNDLATQLQDRSSEWARAAVKKAEYIGLTFADGEPHAAPVSLRNLGKNNLPVAIKLCSALPNSVTQPLPVQIEKIGTTRITDGRPYRFLWLGMATTIGLKEANAADRFVTALGGRDQRQHPATRVHANLLYAYRTRGEQVMNMIQQTEYVQQLIPRGTAAELGRLRLIVHQPDESPYAKLQK